MQKLISSVKQFARSILYPPPQGIKSFGLGSRMLRPRRVEGAEFIEIGQGCFIREYGWFSAINSYAGNDYTPELRIGSNVYIGRFSCIMAAERVTIEDECVLSEHVYIADCSHGLRPVGERIMKQPLFTRGEVRIGKGSFIGIGACVLPGVVLGEHCVVGANTVVTRSYPAYSMIVGNPARMIKKYSDQEGRWMRTADRGEYVES